MDYLRVPLAFPVTTEERALLLEEIGDLIAAFRDDVETGFYAAPARLCRPRPVARRPAG